METTKPEKIFINGLISKEVAPTAPDFILGKMSLNVNELIVWLNHNRKLSDDNGWINLTVLRSKSTGKRYIEVDTWKPKAEAVVETPSKEDSGEANTEDIPF